MNKKATTPVNKDALIIKVRASSTKQRRAILKLVKASGLPSINAYMLACAERGLPARKGRKA